MLTILYYKIPIKYSEKILFRKLIEIDSVYRLIFSNVYNLLFINYKLVYI